MRAKTSGSSGPGGIHATRLHRDQDDGTHVTVGADGQASADPVSLKGYKYNKQFDPRLTSTCPCVPRFHTTFGRPTLYEDVSQELERRELSHGRWRTEANPLPARKDRIIFKRATKSLIESDIKVLDEHGIQVVYAESLNDMLQLEEEMMKVGSYYLNKAELASHTPGAEQPSTMYDRGEVAKQLLEHELEF